MFGRLFYRLCASLAVGGALLLVIGTWLHPTRADPNDFPAAFAEYAATSRSMWVMAHLTQLVGVAAMIVT